MQKTFHKLVLVLPRTIVELDRYFLELSRPPFHGLQRTTKQVNYFAGLPKTVNSNMGRDSGPLITLNIVSQMMLHVVLASFGMELLK